MKIIYYACIIPAPTLICFLIFQGTTMVYSVSDWDIDSLRTVHVFVIVRWEQEQKGSDTRRNDATTRRRANASSLFDEN